MDSAETLAYSPPGSFGEIFLNRKKLFKDGILEEKEAIRVKKEIINKLANLKDPATKKKVVNRVYSREDLYGNDCLKDSPDLILAPADHLISSDFGREIFVSRPAANHEQRGIIFTRGFGVKKAGRIEGARLIDLAPTILHLFKIPSPEKMDGRVLKIA
jgi:predicted AlkP superfamily phosphohydrolase/phosphomutase